MAGMMDLAVWLQQHGAAGCERALRGAMAETVGDLLFVAESEAALLEMGLSSDQVCNCVYGFDL